MIPRWILLLIVSSILCLVTYSTAYADEVGLSTVKYNVQIDIHNAYVGGLCIIKTDNVSITASIVNEFGISLITFKYDRINERIKIVNCVKQLSKPIIKRLLKRDFLCILRDYISPNEYQVVHYVNTNHNITYNLRPL